MFMEIGLVPTKESCRLRPMAESKGPVVMLASDSADVSAWWRVRYSAVDVPTSVSQYSMSSRRTSPSGSAICTGATGPALRLSVQWKGADANGGDANVGCWLLRNPTGSAAGLAKAGLSTPGSPDSGHLGVTG